MRGGRLEVRGRSYGTLVALFEPCPSERLLALMERFVAQGGRLVWSGPPPLLTVEGAPALDRWQALFGVSYRPDVTEGHKAPGQQVVFQGTLAAVPEQVILTDFVVDHLYPVAAEEGAEPVACTGTWTVGTHRELGGGGSATFLGFRPRDDQARSLGYEVRTWFEVLSAIGAYAPTGAFPGHNDNTEHLSRTTDVLACRFPNGAVAVAPHFRLLPEQWPRGFVRDEEADRALLERLDLPPFTLSLRDFRVNGHT